jgi:hypothetical protein
MRELDELFDALEQSAFRSKFCLQAKDRGYLQGRSLPLILEHEARFVKLRLASKTPLNDGKQTPWRGHPIFVAQHATATCRRGCLEKWHAIPQGHELSEEQCYILSVLERWLVTQFDS